MPENNQNDPSIVVWAKEGCHYCSEVKEYLTGKGLAFGVVDVTGKDEWRSILELKYGVRHVPVVEIGKDGVYQGVTEVGIPFLEKALQLS